MDLLPQRPLRIRCDLSSPNQVLEKITGQPPVIVRGAPTVFQLALANRGQLFAAIAAGLASLTVQVRASSDPSSDVLMEKSIATGFNDALSESAWNAGTDQHCEVEFTAEETNQLAQDYWLAIWFDDLSGNPVPCAFGKITVKESGAGTNGTPPEPVDRYYLKTEVDAIFARLVPPDGAYKFIVDGNGAFLALKDAATGTYRKVWLSDGALQVGPEEE